MALPSATFNDQDLKPLRRQLRKARRRLPHALRLTAQRRILKHLTHLPEFRRARRIAVYLPVDGETRTDDLMALAWSLGKEVFLPVLRPRSRLAFAPWNGNAALRRNRFRIQEPAHKQASPARKMDLVFLPLTGFDCQGNRLGMGGGFYDRSFAFRQRPGRWHHPKLIGLAYECQRVAALPAQPWDVPLDAALTERGIHRFNRT